MHDFFTFIAIIDALIILGAGMVGAALFLTGQEENPIFDRAVPAIAILILSSIAAGVVFALMNWINGWVAS